MRIMGMGRRPISSASTRAPSAAPRRSEQAAFFRRQGHRRPAGGLSGLQLRAKMAEVVSKGGSELQRCLYAFAVKTLIGQDVDVDAALLYPAALDSVQKLFPLQDIEATLGQLASAIDLARRNLEAGLALPGIDAADDYNDLAFALPGSASYLPRKMALAKERLGEAAHVWDAK
jgi:hypothetical protein